MRNRGQGLNLLVCSSRVSSTPQPARREPAPFQASSQLGVWHFLCMAQARVRQRGTVRRPDRSLWWLSPGSQMPWVSSRRLSLTCCELCKPLPGPGLERDFIQSYTQSTSGGTETSFPVWFCTGKKIQFWKASDCCFANKLNRWIGNSIYCLFPRHINMWGASINYGLTANKPTHAKAIK